MIREIYKILIITLMLSAGINTNAETIIQREAKKIAEMFFNAAYGEVMEAPEFVYNGRRLATERLFVPFYVYNHPAGGYVIISADNKAFPILAYDMNSHFDPDNIGEDRKALLSEYARHIEYIRFDAQVPHQAIEAWTNLRQHIHNILTAPSIQYNIISSISQLSDKFNEIVETDDIGSISATYFPQQWQEMIETEIRNHRNIGVGIIANGEIRPLIASGYKAGMFRLSLDGSSSGYFRLMPTEIISDGQIAIFQNRPIIEEEPPYEEPPFEFYDRFISEITAERLAQQSAIEKVEIITEPIVRYQGGGHYSISTPEEVGMVRIFSLSGAEIHRCTYSNTQTAIINISHLPNGFYIAVIYSTSAKTYNIKLFR